jgi:hypothetical protein
MAGFIASLYALATTGVPVKRSSPEVVRILKERLQLGEQDTFVDLGCGDGWLLFEITAHFPCQAVGYELSLPLVLWCHWRCLFLSQRRRVRIYPGNFLHRSNLAGQVFFCYLIPGAMAQLAQKIAIMPAFQGARLISLDFTLPGYREREKHLLPDGACLFFYEL